MKKCLICKKDIEETQEICNSCLGFFKWKYKKDYSKKISRFLNLLKKTSLDPIKSNGRYKNE